MPDQKISQLTDGGASQATDEYVIARSGANYRIDGASVAAAATSVGTLTSLAVSGDLTVDTSTLKVDSANNRVGIGTTSPAYPLSVSGAVEIRTANALHWRDGSNTSFASIYNNSGAMAFETAFTERMRLDSSGNLAVDTNTLYVDATNNRVGIGTASPANKLHIDGHSSANQTPDVNITRSSSGTTIQTGPNITFADGTTNNTVTLQATQGRFGVWNYGAGVWNERLAVDASGNLGLGVTPSAWGSEWKAQQFVTYGAIGTWSGGEVVIASNSFESANNVTTAKYRTSNTAQRYRQSVGAGSHIWEIAPSGTAGDTISFTQAMTLDASGNLGVGTASPGARIDANVSGTPPSATSGTVARFVSAGGAGFDSQISVISGNTGGASIFFGDTDADNRGRIRYSNGDDAMLFFTSAVERARIDSSGNFLVGLTSATSGYIIEAQAGTAGTGIRASNTAGGNIAIEVESNATSDTAVRWTNNLKFTNGTERARITSGGYFKASDAGTYTSATGPYHELRSTQNDVTCIIHNTNASYTNAVTLIRSTKAANSDFNLINAQANAVDQFVVRGDGVIYAQNTTIQSLSDARLKENVVDATDGLAVITALRPVRYDWKPGYGNDRVNQLGFIAQEVEAVFPEAVSETTVDEDTYKTVGPGALIPVLVKAIQELEARIAVLEAGA